MSLMRRLGLLGLFSCLFFACTAVFAGGVGVVVVGACSAGASSLGQAVTKYGSMSGTNCADANTGYHITGITTTPTLRGGVCRASCEYTNMQKSRQIPCHWKEGDIDHTFTCQP